MIVDVHKHQEDLSDSPPSYEVAASGSNAAGSPAHGALNAASTGAADTKPVAPQEPIHVYSGMVVESVIQQQPRHIPVPTVYQYINPRTGERVASLLPPSHPEMICLQAGMHEPRSKFGILGILAAIIWFPLGIGLCVLDRKVHCERCGARLNDGVCDL